jgi:hypothetical protein
MSFLNPAGVRIAKFFGSSSRLMSTILKFGGSIESPFAPVTKNGGQPAALSVLAETLRLEQRNEVWIRGRAARLGQSSCNGDQRTAA